MVELLPIHSLNEIETMFSQLAKESHGKLSADSPIAHKQIRLVNSCFSPEKMAIEDESLALLLKDIFLLK